MVGSPAYKNMLKLIFGFNESLPKSKSIQKDRKSTGKGSERRPASAADGRQSPDGSLRSDTGTDVTTLTGSKATLTDSVETTATGNGSSIDQRDDDTTAAAKRVGFNNDVLVWTYSIDTRRSSVETLPEFSSSGDSEDDEEEQRQQQQQQQDRRPTTVTPPNDRNQRPMPPTCWTASADIRPDPVVLYRFARLSATGARVLRFSVSLGESYGASGAAVMVKANSTGKKIRVVARNAARKDVRGGGGPEDAGSRAPRLGGPTAGVFKETFPLPVVVDPTQVTACVDAAGRLMVEALVVSPSDPLLHRQARRHVDKSRHRSAE